MNGARSTSQSWFWPALFLLLGVAGAVVASRLFFQAFPEASIDLRLTRDEIARRSNDVLRGRGFSTEGYRQITLFDFDDNAKTYLERELGVTEANRAMSSQVNLWRWRTRLIKPPEKEEFSVWLTPAGGLVGFQHLVAESLAGASLSEAEAQRVAEVFLKSERRVDLDRLRPVGHEAKGRPHRLDHTFTWEEKDLRLKDATVRMSVIVLGDQVGEFNEFLKIPEQWTRDYARLRSLNDLLAIIATALYVLLLVAAAILLLRSIRTEIISWKPLLLIGSVVGSAVTLGGWNQIGLQLQSMPSNVSYDTWIGLLTVIFLVGGVFSGLLIVLVAAAAEPFYRALLPERLSLAGLFSFRGMRSREFVSSTLIGYGMAGMHIGLVVLFYVVARHFGAWAPLDVKYNNAVSTTAPWLAPLSDSLWAATNEEFTFRLLAIPLLLRWTRSKWVAVLVSAFLWGFLHSNYPQQPAWIRGVEVGMIGILAGWVFLRFGILATLVWHYTVDAVLIGLFLLRSENLTFKLAGALVGDAVFLPLIIGTVLVIQSRGFVRDATLLNSAAHEPPAAREAKREPEAVGFRFLGRSSLATLVLAALAGLVIVAFVPTPRLGDAVMIRTGPARAEAVATDYLRGRGVAVGTFRHVTFLRNDTLGSAADYVLERVGARAAAKLYAEQIPPVSWRTRFYQPLKQEEYVVLVRPDGRVERMIHQLDEKAPGARLDEPAALARAETFLASPDIEPRVHLELYDLKEHDVVARDTRTDHTLVWEAKQAVVGDAVHRVTVTVTGDEVTGPHHWIKIPEAWLRAHTRLTAFGVLWIVFLCGLALSGLVMFMKEMRAVTLRWRMHVLIGAGVALLNLVNAVNSVPNWAVNYTTSTAWGTALVTQGALALVQVIFAFAGVAGLSAIAETLLSKRFGTLPLWPVTRTERGRAVLQGLLAGAASACAVIGVNTLMQAAMSAIPSPIRGLDTGLPGYPVAYLPWLTILTQILQAATWSTLALAALSGIVLRTFGTRARVAIALAVGAAIFAAAGALTPVHFFKLWLLAAVSFGATAALMPLLRFNLVAWFTMYAATFAIGRIGGAWRHPGLQPIALPALIGLGLIAMVVAAFAAARSRGESDTNAQAA